MIRPSQRRMGEAQLSWERAAYLRALIETGAVQIAPDEKRLHRLPGGQRSMIRVGHNALMTRPSPSQTLIGALAAFVERGFDDHVVLAGTSAPTSAHITGAVAHTLGLRQAILAHGGGQPRHNLPANLNASPASAIVVLTDMTFPKDTVLSEAVLSLAQTMQRQSVKAQVYAVAGVAREAGQAQVDLLEAGAALHYLLPLRSIAHDPRLRISPDQRRLLRREFA